MKHLALALATVAFTATASADDDKKYTLADLKALIEQKAYSEAVKHLKDIPPAERKAEWIDIAGSAAAGALNATPDIGSKLMFMVSTEKEYPAILKSQKYLVPRTEAAGPAFSACFQHTHAFQECRDYALAFVDGDPKNAKLTLDIAKVVRRGMSYFAAVPFFKRALAANKPAVVCGDDDLQLAVVSGLGLSSSDSRLAEAIALANACWTDVKDPIVKELTSETGTYNDNVCPLLKKWRALTPELAKRCAKKQ